MSVKRFQLIGLCGCVLAAALLAAQTSVASFQEAVTLVQQGKAAQAIELLEKILVETPADVKALNLMGIALASGGRRVEASRRFEKALEIEPNFVPALKNLAANELALGRRNEARARFEGARKLAPADPVVNLALAEIAYEDRRFAEAVAGYEKGGELLFGDPTAILRYATACAETGRPNEAATAIAKIGRQADAQLQFAAGLLLTRLERYDAAAERFQWAEPNYPDPYTAGYNAALALFRAGKFEDAIRVGKRLAPADQRKAELLNLMAQAFEKAGRTKEAYDALRTATEISPREEVHYLDLITLCIEHKNYDLGLEIARIGLRRIPESYRLLLHRGVAQSLAGALDEAEKDFSRAAELARPEVSLPVVTRSMILIQMDRAGEAVVLLRKRIAAYPDDYLVNWYLAEALTRQGAAPGSAEEQEAEAALERSIRLRSDVTQSRVLLGKLLFKRGDLNGAASQLETALRLDPKDASAAYQLGLLYRRQGNSKLAEELFAKVREVKSEDLDRAGTAELLRIVREGSR